MTTERLKTTTQTAGEAATNSMKRLIYASIISADNDKYTEEQKQEVISRYDKNKGLNQDWKYVLEPVDSTGKLAELFEL